MCFQRMIGGGESDERQFCKPVGVAVMRGLLVVAERGHHADAHRPTRKVSGTRVQVLTRAGVPLQVIPMRGVRAFGFRRLSADDEHVWLPVDSDLHELLPRTA